MDGLSQRLMLIQSVTREITALSGIPAPLPVVVDILSCTLLVYTLSRTPLVYTLSCTPLVHTLSPTPLVYTLRRTLLVHTLSPTPLVHTLRPTLLVDILSRTPLTPLVHILSCTCTSIYLAVRFSHQQDGQAAIVDSNGCILLT